MRKLTIFVVGGGGPGHKMGGGGGGGYVSTGKMSVRSLDTINISVGAGGTSTYSYYESSYLYTNGGITNAGSVSANGGLTGQGYNGGNGGSGGGGTGFGKVGGCGGSDGRNGGDSQILSIYNGNQVIGVKENTIGGVGQGTTTRAFSDSSRTIYAGGGGGSGVYGKALGGSGGGGNGSWSTGVSGTITSYAAEPAAANTGGGGGGGSGIRSNGGSGIAIIRWG